MGLEELKNKESRDKHLASLPSITEKDWKARCAARYKTRGGCSDKDAADFADACFESRVDGWFENDPEGAADEDMSYWNE